MRSVSVIGLRGNGEWHALLFERLPCHVRPNLAVAPALVFFAKFAEFAEFAKFAKFAAA
jgi:hypothetical protein